MDYHKYMERSDLEKMLWENATPTWWIFDREPDMDDIAEQAGDSLEKMSEDLGIYPFQDRGGEDRIFLARFEFPKFETKDNFQYEPKDLKSEEHLGFIDFMTGLKIDTVEMLGAVGQHSTQKDEFTVAEGGGKVAPSFPDHLFRGMPTERTLLNTTMIVRKYGGRYFVDNLKGEPKPERHWWTRVFVVPVKEDEPGPPVIGPQPWKEEVSKTRGNIIPGEFLGLAVRILPGIPWGKQKSSPFIYSGNWMDTVYYTSAVIKEIIDPDDDFPFPRYTVQWRVTEDGSTDDEGVVEAANPSDFAEYQVGDRVTILKDVATEKTTQLWKDEDMKAFGNNWMILPASFYGLDKPEE